MKKFKAFSLLEVTLVLAITGVIISTITPMWHAISVSKKIRTNEEKFNYIRKAMQGYLLRKGHLPTAAEDLNGISSNKRYRGYVPYKTLAIMKKHTEDANGNPFTFIVNEHLCEKEGKTYLPITHASTTCIQPGQITFCRLYHHKGDKLIYDNINTESLSVLDKDKSVMDPADHFFVMNPIRKFKTFKELQDWQYTSITTKEESSKIHNTIAWLLISHGPDKKNASQAKIENKTSELKIHISNMKNDNGVFNDIVFYQTRFDMAAQINCPCTSEPIYQEEEPSERLLSKNKIAQLSAASGQAHLAQ